MSSAGKIHMRTSFRYGGVIATDKPACGVAQKLPPERLVDDKALATCKICRAVKSPEEHWNDVELTRIKQRAYGRALGRLRSKHPQEFEALFAKEMKRLEHELIFEESLEKIAAGIDESPGLVLADLMMEEIEKTLERSPL